MRCLDASVSAFSRHSRRDSAEATNGSLQPLATTSAPATSPVNLATASAARAAKASDNSGVTSAAPAACNQKKGRSSDEDGEGLRGTRVRHTTTCGCTHPPLSSVAPQSEALVRHCDVPRSVLEAF